MDVGVTDKKCNWLQLENMADGEFVLLKLWSEIQSVQVTRLTDRLTDTQTDIQIEDRNNTYQRREVRTIRGHKISRMI